MIAQLSPAAIATIVMVVVAVAAYIFAVWFWFSADKTIRKFNERMKK